MILSMEERFLGVCLGRGQGGLGCPWLTARWALDLASAFPGLVLGWSRLISVMCPTLSSLSHSLWEVSAALHPGKGLSSTTCEAPAPPGTERGSELQVEALLTWVLGTQSQPQGQGTLQPNRHHVGT